MHKNLEFNSKPLEKLCSIFKKNNIDIRIVGGAVRDKILGINSSDIDLATPALPEEVMKIFRSENIKAIPTGIEFGTITIVMNGINFEVTTLREDIETNGRHAVVKYTKDYKIDASRRDFTINALSYDPFEEKIYDYFGGIEDLKNGIVNFIGSAEERIKEDYLRILRFFRFSAFYSSKLDVEGLDACRENIAGLGIISKERIQSELSKMFCAKKNISFCIKALEDIKIFGIIAPKYNLNFSYLLNFEEKIDIFKDIEFNLKELRLALLLSSLGKRPAIDFMKDLKFSNQAILANDIICDFILRVLVEEEKSDIIFEICKGWYYHPNYIKTFLIISYLLGKISLDEMRGNIKLMKEAPPKMPIKSEELMELGYEGLGLGIRIKFLEKQWIKSGFSAQKEILISLK